MNSTDCPLTFNVSPEKSFSYGFAIHSIHQCSSKPLSEMFGYATNMRSSTQGRATYSMHFARYEEVPRSEADEIIARLRILAMFPAAIMAVIRGRLPRQFGIKGVAPNLLLAQPLDPIREFVVQPWAHAIWAETSEANVLRDLQATSDQPIVAVRRLASPLPVDQARAACDVLQRDLAAIGQFAGYVV